MKGKAVDEILDTFEMVLQWVDLYLNNEDVDKICKLLSEGASRIEDEVVSKQMRTFADNYEEFGPKRPAWAGTLNFDSDCFEE